jgi:tryptophan synthase alpha chain
LNRINEKFKDLKRQGKKAFIAFITCGDPSLKQTLALAKALERAGVDILELGVPFSDPLADGPTIQSASQRSLLKGTNLKKIFAFVKNFRRTSQLPIALMTYYNPILSYGLKKFCLDCQRNGVDGVIVPDLPIEEASQLNKSLKERKICSIFFISPTSPIKRKLKTASATTGFIYYLSLTGVTGARKNLSPSLINDLVKTKKVVKNKFLCVGFGISNPAQIKQIKPYCDGIIVGSAIIKIIEKNLDKRDLVKRVENFSKKLVRATHI